MDHLALRRLADQFVTRRLDRLRGFLDDLPLRSRRQRNAQLLFQLLQPVERRTAAVLELSDHGRGRFIVLILAHAFGRLRGEHLSTGAATQTLQRVDRDCKRSLAGDAHQQLRLLLRIDVALPALRTAIAVGQRLVLDLHSSSATEGRGSVAAVSRWRRRIWVRLLSTGACFIFGLLHYRTGFLRVARPHQHRRQGMQRLPQLVMIFFAQRCLTCSIQHPVQFLQVHLDAAPGLLHAVPPSSSRNRLVSG